MTLRDSQLLPLALALFGASPVLADDGPTYTYTMSFTCNTQDRTFELFREIAVAPGRYTTQVQLTNTGGAPSDTSVLASRLFFDGDAIGRPPRTQGLVFGDRIILDPGHSVVYDCPRIREVLKMRGSDTTYVQGALVLRASAPIDVSAVYTTSPLDGPVASTSHISVPGVRR